MFLFPPLNLATIASFIPDDCNSRLIDENFEKKRYSGEEMVFLTSNSYTVNEVYALAKYFKSLGAKVVIKGIHASLVPGEALMHADSIAIGEGENVVEKIINDFKKRIVRQGLKLGK